MFVPNSNGRFRKFRKVRPSGMTSSTTSVAFGRYGLKSLESGLLTSRHLETARKVVSKAVKKSGRVWFRVFPHSPITKKPADVRMGNGKGPIDHWAACIYEGTVILELDGIPAEEAARVFEVVSSKLPLKVKMVSRRFVL